MSKLRSDELVNMEGDGAPSFPQGATTIEPTADNQVATKLYVDSTLSAASGNAVSATAPINPAVGSFWTDTSVSPSLLKTWNGSMWIEFAGTAGAAVGVVVSLPSLSATNAEHAPATITAAAAQVSGATLFVTKWYKDDVEIVGATGSTYVATEPGVYRYEERWADAAGNVLTPSLNKTIELLTIEAPSIVSPIFDTGIPDFDYTAESSAIANIGSVDVLDGSAFGTAYWSGNSVMNRPITTGIDNTGDSLIWVKNRDSNGYVHVLTGQHILNGGFTNSNSASITNIWTNNSAMGDQSTNYITGVLDDGFTIGNSGHVNDPGEDYVGWNFLKTSGFLDIVTFSGDGVTGRAVPHNLGTAPGFIMLKNLTLNENWMCYHKEAALDGYLAAHERFLQINNTSAAFPPNSAGSASSAWGNTAPDENNFYLGGSVNSNSSGSDFVAYLFADNPSNGIKCGTYTGTDYSGPVQVDCGFEAQWVMIKSTVNSDRWRIYWSGSSTPGSTSLTANTHDAEDGGGGVSQISFTNSGFTVENSAGYSPNWADKFVFVAIGTPQATVSNTQLTLTDTTVSKISDGSLINGTSIDQVLTVGETVQADTAVTGTVSTPVFGATTYSGNSSTKTVDTGIDLDAGGGLIWIKKRGSQNHCLQDTEQGLEYFAPSNATSAFYSSTTRVTGATSTGFTLGNDSEVNSISEDYASWSFREAPAFFDVVTYTGQYTYPASYAVPHSLGSVPGMIIIKQTSGSSGWTVWHKDLSSTTGRALDLHSTAFEDVHSGFFPTAPNADNFYLGDNSNINQQNQSYVAYVFADTPGVIKCGTYTGTGSSQTIDTGFKPKFVLTKSRSHSSDWYLMDSVNPGQALYTNWSGGQQNVPIGYVDNGFTVDGRNFALNEIGYAYIYMAIAEDAEVDITSDIRASGTVSASTGNTITLSNASGTWSTGMKIQGVTTDTKDNPDRIDASAVTFTSSEPATTSGTVSTWDYAEWNLSHDSAFSGVVHQKAVPLTATGTQAGPDDFTIQPGTEYFVRTKYASSLPTGQSDWSAVTRFLTKHPGGWTTVATQDILSNPSGQNRVSKVIKDGDYYIIFGYGQYNAWISKTTDFQTFESFASLPSPAMTITSACSFGPGKYIVVGRPMGGNAWNCVHTTTNGGASWNLYPLNNGNLGTIYSPNPSITDVAWDGANSFCITIGNNVNESQYTHIWISNDLGQTFNQVSEPSPQYCTWNKVTFFGGKFVLFGGRTARESGTWTNRPRIAYSTNNDYSGWSNATFPGSDDTGRMFYDFFVSNNKLHTAPFGGGGSPTMLESADGMTFTSVGGQNSSYSSYGNFLASDGETIVLKNYDNRVMTSQDLNLPFQTHYAPSSAGTLGFDYVGDRFFAYHYDDSDHTYPVLSYNYTGLES